MPGSAGSFRRAVFASAAWSVALRWSIRLLGLISTAILARLLTPADFGLVAMGMLVVGFVDAWFSTGLDTALIQTQNANREHYDTAWTMRILQSLAVMVGVACAAPFAAIYFDEPRVTMVIWMLCLGLPIAAVSNIGAVAFRKELQFQKEFKLNVTAKVLGFCLTIGVAIWLRSYWALVIGTLGGYVLGCMLTYLMHPYRPRLSLAKVRELWSFSQWMLVRSLGHFAEMRADEVIVGGVTSTREMGVYTLAAELGRLPGSEIAAPLNQALIPSFAKLQSQRGRLGAAYLNALGTISAVTLPASVGLALVAKEFVLVLMGPQWTDATPLLMLLAFSSVIRTGDSLAISVLFGTGRSAIAAAMSWTNALLLIGFALLLVGKHGVIGVAVAKVISGVVLMAISHTMICRITGNRIHDVARRLWRPAVASLVMAVSLTAVSTAGFGAVTDLAIKVVMGVAAYSAAILVLWRIAGCPDGIERLVLNQIRQRLARSATNLDDPP